MEAQKTALVIGAAGGVGFETAKALIAHGWRVRALARDVSKIPALPGATLIAGDAMDGAAVMRAAAGADVIVHAANPPGYRDWRGLGLPMLNNAVAAAVENRARLAFPGNIYNYGPDAFPVLTEDAPQNPVSKKGAVRVEMEQRLESACAQGARVLILRAGDFFGPHSAGSWLSQGMVKPGQRVRSVSNPSAPGVGHAWAYLPDFAETFVQLLDRESALEAFARFHFGGHWFARGEDFAEAIVVAAGQPGAPIRQFPWTMVHALGYAPFAALFRELAEMHYLWRTPVRLDNSKLVAFLGAEPRTPLDVALRTTLDTMGCLGLAPALAEAL